MLNTSVAIDTRPSSVSARSSRPTWTRWRCSTRPRSVWRGTLCSAATSFCSRMAWRMRGRRTQSKVVTRYQFQMHMLGHVDPNSQGKEPYLERWPSFSNVYRSSFITSYTICNSICQVRPPGGRSVVGSSGPALTGGRCQCSRYYLPVLGFVSNYTKKEKKPKYSSDVAVADDGDAGKMIERKRLIMKLTDVGVRIFCVYFCYISCKILPFWRILTNSSPTSRTWPKRRSFVKLRRWRRFSAQWLICRLRIPNLAVFRGDLQRIRVWFTGTVANWTQQTPEMAEIVRRPQRIRVHERWWKFIVNFKNYIKKYIFYTKFRWKF